MPTYVYACRACEDRTEVVQKMSDPPLTDCAKCGGSLRRVLFPPAVVYKGSGFYVTDYKNGSGGRSGTGESKSETSSETKTETKSETSTAAKSEPKTSD